MLSTLPTLSKPYIYWLAGLRCPKPLISAGLQVFARHFAAKNFLHGGGRAELNSPMAAERLLKLFIFFKKHQTPRQNFDTLCECLITFIPMCMSHAS
jgi:hypothetical protein